MQTSSTFHFNPSHAEVRIYENANRVDLDRLKQQSGMGYNSASQIILNRC